MRARVLCLSIVALAAAMPAAAQQQSPSAAASTVDVAALQAEVERLRSIVPGQATAMTQVAYNFSNLWFAARAANWPLAQFYLNETRVRLRWAVRITPVRKIGSGELALQPILDGIEKGALAVLDGAVAAKDRGQVETAYRGMLDACHGCHVASEKPYLRLQIPTSPAEPLIRFEAE